MIALNRDQIGGSRYLPVRRAGTHRILLSETVHLRPLATVNSLSGYLQRK